MNWKKMSEEKPLHGQRVLYAISCYTGDMSNKMQYSFRGYLKVFNPYQEDKKFNPDFWEREHDRCAMPSSRIAVSESDIWCELELPKELL